MVICLRYVYDTMKAKIRLYKNDGENEQGFPIKIILSHNRKTRRKTIAYSKEIDWDSQENIPLRDHPDKKNVYDKVYDIKKLYGTEEFRDIVNFDRAFEYLLGAKKKEVDFFEYAEERIAYMESSGRSGNARAYRNAITELKKFRPSITFKELNKDLLESFKEYKKSEGNKNSTVKNYLVEIRAIYNSAVKTGITEDKKPFAGLFEDIPVRKRRARNRYLSREQVEQLEALKLDPSYQRAIDLSLLQFYLCGADLTDVYYLKNEDITKDRVFLSRNKLGNKKYEFDVLLSDKAKNIIDKYKVKGEYVFPWKKAPESYITFRNNHNRNLKIIQKRLELELQPKNDNLTTKVMRHTFATLGKFERIEEDLLRELMGHERDDIDTIYKDKYPEAERDAAQLKIIGYL